MSYGFNAFPKGNVENPVLTEVMLRKGSHKVLHSEIDVIISGADKLQWNEILSALFPTLL